MTKKSTTRKQTEQKAETLTIELPREFDEAKYALALGTLLRDSVSQMIESTDLGNVIAQYDDGSADFGEEVANEAATWLATNFIGSLPFNIIHGKHQGQQMLDRARDATKKAFQQNALFRNEKTQDRLTSANRWECQMDLQQHLRESVRTFAEAIYFAAFEQKFIYQGKNAKPVDGDMTPKTAVESSIASRFASNG